ncbi:hypothetical protein ACLOJK_040877 [Asimina triloba]
MDTLTLSASVPAFKPPSSVGYICPSASPTQYAIFFIGLYMIALGTGGIKPCASVTALIVIPEDWWTDIDIAYEGSKMSITEPHDKWFCHKAAILKATTASNSGGQAILKAIFKNSSSPGHCGSPETKPQEKDIEDIKQHLIDRTCEKWMRPAGRGETGREGKRDREMERERGAGWEVEGLVDEAVVWGGVPAYPVEAAAVEGGVAQLLVGGLGAEEAVGGRGARDGRERGSRGIDGRERRTRWSCRRENDVKKKMGVERESTCRREGGRCDDDHDDCWQP